MDLLDLEVSDVRIVGIWGEGGVGKTTIAKVIYEQISSQFDSCSFLADIAVTTKQLGGVQVLQSKLMSDILKQEYEIDHVAKGVNFFKEVLQNMKVLIVLDDVEERSHLQEIVGEKLDRFGYGSRIIVTTSITSILPEFISRGLVHVYKINMMNNDQALELFRKHALRSNLSVPGFDEAAKDIINSMNKIPLLIEVISSLLDRKLAGKLIAKEKPILEFGLHIQEILMVSYEELSEVQRQIFLDIACLPADVDCRIASFMWHNPRFPPSDGVDALLVKSLVKIGRNNELRMHRLLREFGLQIIQTEDHLDPGRRGRLCNLELAWNTKKIEMPHLKVLNLTGCADLLISPNLSSFSDLEILILERCSQLMKLDTSIRYLKRLTSLNLRFCNELNMLPIELGHLKALKELLIDGTSVQEIPVAVVHMKQLEIFSASNCLQLSHLPDSLCGLTALSVLLLENAKITRIPVSVEKLGKLQHLSLKDCHWIERLPDSIRNLEWIEQLDITGTGISKLPNSITCFRQLKVLKMDYCFIRELPKEIRNLANLEELHASYCKSLKGAIPTAIKSLDHLRILKLGNSSISGLPSEIISLSCLQTLDLLQCNKIQALPELPTSLTCLRVSSEKMKALPDLKDLVKLEEICLGNKDPKELICASTWKKPKARLRDPLFVPIGLPKLKILELSHSKIINLSFTHGPLSCRHLKKLVLSGVNLQEVSELPSSLSVLSIQRCFSLKGLPAVGNLRTLSELNLIQSAVEEIEGLEGLISLEILNISYCEIRNLSGLGQLRALRSFILSDCDALDKLPDISSLKMLNVLEVQRCREIHDIEGLMELTSLEVLHVSECKAENTREVQDALKLLMARSLNS
ncbi:hypothetical protein EUGRSUZ_H02212 [Eucalyptus grandis]|uniref:Uncharacterized protein n=3 Tax=Eucalyptus grandis TaxID=71139 RepID=A0A059B0E3_EUCGR|nr:hypothetical protein EUGRSUZ_H02212 [Eucalyptus grandis]KAK3416456.1 hypothetical protein EUGRSUZ_H02212 [Eucalyptus grandis]